MHEHDFSTGTENQHRNALLTRDDEHTVAVLSLKVISWCKGHAPFHNQHLALELACDTVDMTDMKPNDGLGGALLIRHLSHVSLSAV